jgi:hypothetical protein
MGKSPAELKDHARLVIQLCQINNLAYSNYLLGSEILRGHVVSQANGKYLKFEIKVGAPDDRILICRESFQTLYGKNKYWLDQRILEVPSMIRKMILFYTDLTRSKASS